MSDPLLPSAEALFVAWAAAHPTLAALHGGRVATKVDPVRPCLRVQRLGPPQLHRWEDAPVLQVEAWSPDEVEADALIRLLVAALPDVCGEHVVGAVVSGWEVVGGPRLEPDDSTEITRYLLDVQLFLTPPGSP